MVKNGPIPMHALMSERHYLKAPATTIKNEMKLEPSKSKTLAEFMDKEQFNVLHEFTWQSAQRKENVMEKLLHFVRYLIQGILVYACLRGRDEIALCEVDVFCMLDERSIRFQMKRDFKSIKLGEIR